MKILVVDDMEIEHVVATHAIKAFDDAIEVVSEYGAQEAMDKLKASETVPDLILLDINMPGMNGFDFLDEFAKLDPLPTITIAMLSSSNQASDIERCLEFPFVKHFFTKPLEPEHLTAVLNDLKNTNP